MTNETSSLADRLTNFAQAIKAAEDRLAPKVAALAKLTEEREQFEAQGTSAATVHAASARVLSEARARHATGEAGDTDLSAARTAFALTEKAVARSRQRDGDIAEIAAAERVLVGEIDTLKNGLKALRDERAGVLAEARFAAAVAELHARAEKYTAAAVVMMRCLADTLALDEVLTGLGKPQGIRTPGLQHTMAGSFVGHPLPELDLMQAARAQARADFGSL